MKVTVNRLLQTEKSTISTVEVDGVLKYYGMETPNPIPAGTYQMLKYYSPDHGQYVPLVENVPGHAGIEIHAGNFPADTKNCLLLGAGLLQTDFIGNSRQAVNEFYKNFFAAIKAGIKCTITYNDLWK